MEQRDYLQREIEKLGIAIREMISRITGFGKNGDFSQGIEMTNETLQSELDMDIDDLISVPTDEFIDTLLAKQQLDEANLELLADALLSYGDNLLENDDATKKLIFERALLIYEHIDKEGGTFSFERRIKIDKIKEAL